MRKLFNTYLPHILSFAKCFPTVMTTRDDLAHLLQRLRPVSCDKALIRLGPDGDGGYLVPDDLVGIEVYFSPGVRFLSGFEKDCAELGMTWQALKPTLKPILTRFHLNHRLNRRLIE